MTVVRIWIGSLLFNAYLFLSVPVFALGVFAAAAVSGAAAFAVVRMWARAVLFMLRVLCRLDYRVSGLEHLEGQNCVVLMKHSSAWETIAQLVVFPQQSWVMKRELLWVPVLGWVLPLFKPIAINRSGGRSAVEQVLRQGRERLAQGYWVMIFPEGTRVPVGEKRRYGISGALLASSAGHDLLPVAHNAGRFWPRRGVRKWPGTIRMVIGPRMPAGGREPRAINAEIEAWIDAEVVRLGADGRTQPSD
jgi:1-acyl-sn-glycerol-3-phosphate acyltransferase